MLVVKERGHAIARLNVQNRSQAIALGAQAGSHFSVNRLREECLQQLWRFHGKPGMPVRRKHGAPGRSPGP